MGSRCTLLRPGLVDYDEALQLQRRIADGVRAGSDAALILLEHPPTYTLGARGDEAHILSPVAQLEATGARVVRTDRGGDVTFHGPGQIVGYPMMNLRARGMGAVSYVRTLEQLLIDAIAEFGIAGTCAAGRPGVWTASGKIAAIGVRISGGVTTHGFALNVSTNLAWFSHIIPCGLAGATVTSMHEMGAESVTVPEVMDAVTRAFASAFAVRLTKEVPAAAAGENLEVAVGR